METRIQRHKNYRAELIKQGSEKAISEKPRNTTTALPINDVMDVIHENESHNSFYKQQKRLRIIEFSLIVCILIAVVVGVIIFGLYAFRG